MVLIDIENIAATPSPSEDQVVTAMQFLREVVPGFDTAQRVVGCIHRAAVAVGCVCRTERRLWRSGPDGADLALLEVLQNERVDDRFEYVTVCSGDGIFAQSVARLAGNGVDVSVVAVDGHLAARLQLAARRVTYLPSVAALTFGNAS